MSVRTLLFGAALLAPAAAHAQADARERVARQHFRVAEQHFAREEFEEAFREYETAYAIAPLPGFLFNMGQCQRKLGNTERAVNFYRRYLEEAPDAENRALVDGFLRDLGAEPAAPPPAPVAPTTEPSAPAPEPPSPPRPRPVERGLPTLPVSIVGSGLGILLVSGALTLYTRDRTDPTAETLQTASLWTGVGVLVLGTVLFVLDLSGDSGATSGSARLSSRLRRE